MYIKEPTENRGMLGTDGKISGERGKIQKKKKGNPKTLKICYPIFFNYQTRSYKNREKNKLSDWQKATKLLFVKLESQNKRRGNTEQKKYLKRCCLGSFPNWITNNNSQI